MDDLEDYSKEIEIYSEEDHELFQEVGIKIVRNLQKKYQQQASHRLKQSRLILKMVYCHNIARTGI